MGGMDGGMDGGGYGGRSKAETRSRELSRGASFISIPSQNTYSRRYMAWRRTQQADYTVTSVKAQVRSWHRSVHRGAISNCLFGRNRAIA